MTAFERTGFRDEDLSRRHREWGKELPACDIDFLLVEMTYGNPVAIVDYKYEFARAHDPRHTNHLGLSSLGLRTASGGFKQLPYFVVYYKKDPWRFLVYPQNESACIHIGLDMLSLSEHDWVDWLYRLRGGRMPEDVATACDRHVDEVESWDQWHHFYTYEATS